MLDDDYKPSDEIRKTLDELLARRKVLSINIDMWKKELAQMQAEYESLAGSSYSRGASGLIADTQTKLKYALLRESDANATKVVWNFNRTCHPKGLHVVRKVTARRIFVSEIGSDRCDQFNLDGTVTAAWKHSKIDIRATFGIDADSVPPGWKPSK